MNYKISRRAVSLLVSLMALITATSYGSIWLTSKILNDISSKEKIFGSVLMILGIYFAVKFATVCLNITYEYLQKKLSISEYEKAWTIFLPDLIAPKDAGRFSEFHNTVKNNVPQLFMLKLDSINKILSTILLITVAFVQSFSDGLYLGVVAGSLVVLFSFASGFFLQKKYQDSVSSLSKSHTSILRWMETYFRHFKEIKSNISAITGKPARSLGLEAASDNAGIMKKHARLELYRDLFGALFVDLPPLLLFSYLFYQGYLGLLSIGSIYFWLALFDRFVEAGVSLRQLKDNRIYINSLEKVISEEMAWAQSSSQTSVCQTVLSSDPVEETFSLIDGSKNTLSLKPGIYQITGRNGSGKSTLIDSLIGLNSDYEYWDKEMVWQFAGALKNHYRTVNSTPARLIEAESFSELLTQTKGFCFDELKADIGEKLSFYLSSTGLVDYWLERAAFFDQVFISRAGSFSLGESVQISFLRMIYSLKKDVRVILCDEADSPLDALHKKPFYQSLKALSTTFAIYFISHSKTAVKPPMKKSSLDVRSYLVGYSKAQDQALPIPLHVKAVSSESSEIIGLGSIGSFLKDTAAVALEALIASDEKYQILRHYRIVIDCDSSVFKARETRSAGLTLAICFLNIYRMAIGNEPEEGIAATGAVMLDGTICSVDYEEEKTKAISGHPWIKKWVTASSIDSLTSLETQVFMS